MGECNRIKNSDTSEVGIYVKITDELLCDRLNILSVEYSISKEILVQEAVRHLLDNVEFIRGLRRK
jgi:predicted DNA-binding protein